MAPVVDLSVARRVKARRAAVMMARSGAPESAVLAKHGRDAAEWARARLWCENGSDPTDRRGQELYVEIFGGGEE